MKNMTVLEICSHLLIIETFIENKLQLSYLKFWNQISS